MSLWNTGCLRHANVVCDQPSILTGSSTDDTHQARKAYSRSAKTGPDGRNLSPEDGDKCLTASSVRSRRACWWRRRRPLRRLEIGRRMQGHPLGGLAEGAIDVELSDVV